MLRVEEQLKGGGVKIWPLARCECSGRGTQRYNIDVVRVEASRSTVYTLPSETAVVAMVHVHHVHLWISPKGLHGAGMRPRVSYSLATYQAPHHNVPTSDTIFWIQLHRTVCRVRGS